MAVYARALRLDPEHAEAHFNLGLLGLRNGDVELARVSFEKALALEPNNALIKQNYELFKEINDRTTRKDSPTDPDSQ